MRWWWGLLGKIALAAVKSFKILRYVYLRRTGGNLLVDQEKVVACSPGLVWTLNLGRHNIQFP